MKWLSYLHMFKRPVVGEAARARFMLGDRVSVRQGSPHDDGSPPYYLRGKFGVVEEICTPFTSPDRTASKPAREAPRRSYRMRFSAREVWPNLPGASGETLTMRISEDWLMPLH